MVRRAVVLRFGSSSCSLDEGQACLLGRGTLDQPVDLHLSKALDLSRRAACVTHGPSGRWSVRALTERNGVAVRHPGGSVIQVAAGTEVEMPTWFDDAYLVVTTPSAELDVRIRVVDGAVPPTSARARAAPAASTTLVLPADLERADFRTALVLCEPMLDDPFNRRVPTEGELASRLVALGREPEAISARTVERRLARLRDRLQVPSNADLRDRLVAAGLVTRSALDQLRGRSLD